MCSQYPVRGFSPCPVYLYSCCILCCPKNVGYSKYLTDISMKVWHYLCETYHMIWIFPLKSSLMMSTVFLAILLPPWQNMQQALFWNLFIFFPLEISRSVKVYSTTLLVLKTNIFLHHNWGNALFVLKVSFHFQIRTRSETNSSVILNNRC